MSWRENKRRSDRFIPEITTTSAPHVIGEPPTEDDQKHNTDVVVVRTEPVRIACRVRRPEYYERYPHEFTIRSGLRTGVKTELAKITEGWGDYLFYGHADATENRLRAWMLCDLWFFRLWL